MASLIDTSLWVNYTRRKTPPLLRALVAEQIESADAVLAEPVIFELANAATNDTLRLLDGVLANYPILQTPGDLWTQATRLGRACRSKGIRAGSLDLLIVAVAASHRATLVSLDADFLPICRACGLKVLLLKKPA